ncbi:MAG: hypothetical protein KJ732_06590 [Candidatus Margulisbacteria bacterium]|nr:hypothetical protein [Candidatus Margulisiibacteriota bacterium]
MVKKKAKKKAKKTKKVKKIKKKKVVHRKRVAKIKAKGKGQRPKAKGEKVIGRIDHFFGHISVAAFKVKSPLKVGDSIHVKGHTTDFVQSIDSIQSDHQDIQKAGKGDEIGIKVIGKCRVGDTVFLAAKPLAAKPKPASPKAYENKKFLQF